MIWKEVEFKEGLILNTALPPFFLSFLIRPTIFLILPYPSYYLSYPFLSVLLSFLSFLIRPTIFLILSYPSYYLPYPSYYLSYPLLFVLLSFLSFLIRPTTFLSFLIRPTIFHILSYPPPIFLILSNPSYYLFYPSCPFLTISYYPFRLSVLIFSNYLLLSFLAICSYST